MPCLVHQARHQVGVQATTNVGTRPAPRAVQKGSDIVKPETIRKILSGLLSFGEPATDEQLARKVYGDSPAWKRSRKIIASTAGVAGRLRARGLVARTADERWYVTEAGRAYLTQKQPEVPAAPPARPEVRERQPAAMPGWVPWPAAPGGFLWFDGGQWLWPDGYGGWWPWVWGAP